MSDDSDPTGISRVSGLGFSGLHFSGLGFGFFGFGFFGFGFFGFGFFGFGFFVCGFLATATTMLSFSTHSLMPLDAATVTLNFPVWLWRKGSKVTTWDYYTARI